MKCSGLSAILSLRILLIFLLFVEATFASTVIKLKNEVYLEKDRIFLKDISTITSDNSSFKQFLGNIYVGNLKGNQKIITKKQIKDILNKNYIDTSKVRVVGSKVLVKKFSAVIDKNKLRKDVGNFLKRNFKNIEVESISYPNFRVVKGKNLHVKIKKRTQTSSYIYLTYEIHDNGRLVKRLIVPVRYRQVSYVVYSKEYIRRGEIITKDKVELKKYIGNPRHLITSIQNILGSRAKINIRKGIPIKEYMIEPNYFVDRGSNVKIIYNKGLIHIELLGRALENGQLNQIIKVKNISTGKVIPCKVIGKNQVLFIGGSF